MNLIVDKDFWFMYHEVKNFMVHEFFYRKEM